MLCLFFVSCVTPNASFLLLSVLAVLGFYDTLIIFVHNNNTKIIRRKTAITKALSQMKYTNLFLILFGLIASMSGLPAYLNNNRTELFINCGPTVLDDHVQIDFLV